MLHCFDPIRTLSFWAILVRLTLAVICGGVIGAERETKRRPAGFRTHILICLGAAITTLTSQYLLLSLHLFTDVARLGAQVISGIGFIGAGTIIVTRDKRVKGLTTAAGLWAAAIIGLACGAGYVECAVFATLGIVSPSLVIITVIAALLSNFAHIAAVQNAFAGIRVAVCVLIFNSIVKLWKKSVVDKLTFAVFLAVFIGSVLLSHVSPVVFIVAAAVLGIVVRVWLRTGKEGKA